MLKRLGEGVESLGYRIRFSQRDITAFHPSVGLERGVLVVDADPEDVLQMEPI